VRGDVPADTGGVALPPLLEALHGRLRVLDEGVLDAEALPGGLTNHNFKVTTRRGTYVVRLAGQTSDELAIDRRNEYENTLAAAEVGVGAPVVEHLEEPSVLVVGWIEGTTLSAELLRSGRYTARIAEACRRLHSARRFLQDFDMFLLQRRYLSLVRAKGLRLPESYERYEGQVRRMELAMAVRPERRVPCNNDLLAENFIDDGERVWIIDYEYSGNNEPSFELGNIWSESALSLDELEALVGAYYGRVSRAKVARARLWGLMSKYGWTLWASIQDGLAEIDFDFWSWGMEKYERAVAEFEGPDFERLLEDVVSDEGA
jgi:thiamine kinase-like enzyme